MKPVDEEAYYRRVGSLYLLEWAIAALALAFLGWAFGWKAAVGWALIQWYANLRADNRSRKS